jgi:transglutaminase-like putative cysteine protease
VRRRRRRGFRPPSTTCIKQPAGRRPLSRAGPVLLALLLAVPLSGCLDQLGLGGLGRPDHAVSRTPLEPGTWTTESRFTVQVMEAQPIEVRIEASPPQGEALVTSGFSDQETPVSMDLPDGTWTVTYFVDGHRWESFSGVRVDTVAPSLAGIDTLVEAPEGSATIGGGAAIAPADRVQVIEQASGSTVATAIPARLSGLADGVHAYDVVATDPAGNQAVATVQVLAGSANELPAGRFTAGIVARYSLTARLWDLADLDAYASPAEARAAAGDLLGEGTGIAPDDPAVQRAIREAGVDAGMTTAEAALALYRWMFDHLEYQKSRLDESDLLDPAETLAQGGGVCRDLAALYVSLLRGAGIPARLVAGYLAGQVDGFHAWVEFYGGGADPWIPVDVSGIGASDDPDDDAYTEAAMLQSFAIALPEHLPLRALTPAQERTEWHSAATVSYTKPSRSADPRVEFSKDACNEARCGGFEEARVLCVDLATRERAVVDRGACRKAFIDGFVSRARWVLDFGVTVASAEPGTTITVAEVFPESAATAEWLSYGGQFTKDAATGRIQAQLHYR